MKINFAILFLSINLLTGCSKSDTATKKIITNWRLKNFYINDVDKTDSMRALTPYWFYSFTERPHEIHGNFITGGWGFTENNAKKMIINIQWSDTTYAGPFLVLDSWITWDFNYDKLCDDNELWITTNYDNKKYENHFVSFQ